MGNKRYRVIVAHPGKQHSYQTVKALNRDDIDLTYITTVYDKKNSLTNKLKGIFLNGDNLKRANSRNCAAIADKQVVQFCELSGLVTLFLLRVDKSKKIYRKWNDWVFNRFGHKVAKFAVKENADMVIMFDANAKPCFEYLKENASNIVKVLDVSIAARPYQRVVYESDIAKTGLTGLKEEQVFLWNDDKISFYQKEIKYTDYFMAPSEFVKKSLKYCGVEDRYICKVPYGVETNRFEYHERCTHGGPLKLVMAGQVSYRKGFHHLIKVLKNYSKDDVQLVLFGALNHNDDFFEKNGNLENIDYRGFVTQEKIIEEYKKSDVYIFPSLCEGLSLSVLEAMSCGLPVLLSDHSGANDAVEDGKNGKVFVAGDDEKLKETIDWYIKNRDRLLEMGRYARNTAQRYSWDSYYSNYFDSVLEILKEREEKCK